MPSRAELLDRFSYNPSTGEIVRRDSGAKAFATPTGNGYLRGGIGRDSFLAHRIAWKMTFGNEPHIIDHINGMTTDNRIANLRDVSHRENGRNSRIHRNNRSGHTGVSWQKRERKWRASIWVGNKRVTLGQFDMIEDALAARRKAQRAVGGYTERHGS